MKEPLRLLLGGIIKTLGEVLGILLESYFQGARINKGPERSLNTTKTGANSIA